MAVRVQGPFMPMPVANSPVGTQLINAIYQASINTFQKPQIDQILLNPVAREISPVDLGHALVLSIHYFRDEYYGSILDLPAAQNIPANGQGGIGHALTIVCRLQDPDILRSLKNHPMFVHINPNGAWGLGDALDAYLNAFIEERQLPDDPNPEYLQATMLHPAANQINYTQPRANLIGKALMYLAGQSEVAFRDEDTSIVNLLLSLNIAHLIQPNGEFGLGRVLANAAYGTTPDIVNAILAHPASRSITSHATLITENENTKAEEAGSSNQFGFTEAIFLAVDNGEPEVQNPLILQKQIVQSLIQFTNMNNIPLDANGPFGLAKSLTVASSDNPSLVPIILSSNSSLNIRPNAPDENSGGLNNALIHASSNEDVQAVQSILQHPNARLIQPTDFTEAHNLAVNSPQITQAIKSFVQLHQIGTN